MSWPSGLLKFSVMVRLFREITFHHKPCPSFDNPCVRAGSPLGMLHLDDIGSQSPSSMAVIVSVT